MDCKRVIVPEIEELIGVPFPYLDKGHITVLEYMGSDQTVDRAARNSHHEDPKLRDPEETRFLLRLLMRGIGPRGISHTSPFEHCKISFSLKIPMDVWREWGRHRTGTYSSISEYSTRYTPAIDESLETDNVRWRKQDSKNKQSSSGFLDMQDGDYLTTQEAKIHELTKSVYKIMLGYGVAREQARKLLTLDTYTTLTWTIDLHNLLWFLLLRMDEAAQVEIREGANIIGHEIVSRWVPETWRAFLDYRFKAIRLSLPEQRVIRELITGDEYTAKELAKGFDILKFKDGKLKRGLELVDLEIKLNTLGIPIPNWEKEDDSK